MTNDDKIKILHLSNNKLIGICSSMDVGNKQVLSASLENGF